MSIKELLSSSKTKGNLTAIFAKALTEHCSNKEKRVFSTYVNRIVGPDTDEEHTHEEADTLIPHLVLASMTNNECREITVASPDTDVLILLLDLVSHNHLHEKRTFNSSQAKARDALLM